ncbi:IS481 family transposase [Citricoccus sp. I39-566]|uniref:IS481 family transposase n=1 Tax=Citricoccus sp. I39-566 TaxID=3073268 RepID=UPI00286BF881|nr:IS481 family transposase [Citricoccus sp. I39-566]WMY79649.1 IS481 family transposase [Citricoccus sp. I39-566]
MSHRNTRLTVHGRRLIVQRHQDRIRPPHIAAAMGVSRQCVYKWIGRYAAEGETGLADRSSRPHTMPTKTTAWAEERVVAARRQHRAGPAVLAPLTGVPARTISRILTRRQIPPLDRCDPLTGDVIRSSKVTAVRYERAHPEELVHVDVKKLGKIPDGGGWRAHRRSEQVRGRGIGYDYVHSMVDDHSRLAYSEVLPNEQGSTCAGFLIRAAAYFADQGITRIERVITDNAFAYRKSTAFHQACVKLGAVQKFIKPHCPWQNGKVERFNRTLATEWAYRKVFTSNNERQAALAPWLKYYNTERSHSALGGHPPTNRLSPT